MCFLSYVDSGISTSGIQTERNPLGKEWRGEKGDEERDQMYDIYLGKCYSETHSLYSDIIINKKGCLDRKLGDVRFTGQENSLLPLNLNGK